MFVVFMLFIYYLFVFIFFLLLCNAFLFFFFHLLVVNFIFLIFCQYQSVHWDAKSWCANWSNKILISVYWEEKKEVCTALALSLLCSPNVCVRLCLSSELNSVPKFIDCILSLAMYGCLFAFAITCNNFNFVDAGKFVHLPELNVIQHQCPDIITKSVRIQFGRFECDTCLNLCIQCRVYWSVEL